MQTFLPYKNIKKSVGCLDNKRLGKQRVEAIQILLILSGITPNSRWKNHPAVLMWKGHETYLLLYLYWTMLIWKSRGFKNNKCQEHFINLAQKLEFNHTQIESLCILERYYVPKWLTYEFCLAHQSNLMRKYPEYYRNYFPNVPNDLPYIWPVQKARA